MENLLLHLNPYPSAISGRHYRVDLQRLDHEQTARRRGPDARAAGLTPGTF